MAKIVVFGVSQWASLAYFYFTHDSPHEVVAFAVDRSYLKEKEFFGLPVIPFDEIDQFYPPDKFSMFVPVSFKKMNHIREKKYFEAKAKGYTLVSYVSSKATTWPGLVHGDNCFILEDNTIQPFVTIGNNVVLWSGNHIGHHAVIKDHCFISSHVVVCGCVVIEPYCFLGVNSTIRDEVTVAKECLIGAGALILKDTKEYEVYKGAPAELMGIPSDNLRSISYRSQG